MQPRNFCSVCGMKLTPGSRRFALFNAYCDECGPGSRPPGVILAAAVVLLVIFGFGLARVTTSKDRVFLIGTPIERVVVPGGNNPDRAETSNGLTPATDQASGFERKEGICGAPTRSGRPCSRKVKGGGFCWQHRDKTPRSEPLGKPPKAVGDRVL